VSICRDIYELIKKNLPNILKLRDIKMTKKDNSFVTEGDLLCQKLILDYADSLSESFYVVSEELDATNFCYNEKNNYIVIDPIDGTENFTSGLKEWGISVSIYKNGSHFESMLDLPELNLKLVTGDKVLKYNSRIYGLSSSLTKNDLMKVESGFEYRITGCCVYNIYNIINGSFAVFENFKGAYVWDILAGINIALEHNLKVVLDGKKYNGEFLSPNKKYRFRIQH
jgi:Archaeal fructose-1,6-bisphosphatase and related enzymes of inositol monophosphatase family